MANIYLESGDTSFIVANNDSQVYDSAGVANTILMNDGVTGVEVASTIEDIDFSGDFADYQFQQVDGTANVVVLDGSGNPLVTLINTFTARTVSFADGTVDVVTTVSGTDIVSTVGGVAITTTAAAVDTTDPDFTIDAGDVSSNAAGSTPGQTFTLTTGDDVSGVLVGDEGTTATDGDDTFEGTDTTYTANDILVGGPGNDVLNITSTATTVGAANSVVGIEIVNVDFSTFGAPTFDAEGILSADINVSQSQAGASTNAIVNNLSTTSILNAGDTLTGTLTVGTSAGTINANNAAQVDADLASDGATITINADDDTNTINLAAKSAVAGTTTDKAVIAGAGTIVLDPEATDDKVVENLTLAGNGAAVTYDITDGKTAGNTLETLTLTGDQDITIIASSAALAGLDATADYADDTTDGTVTVNADEAAGANIDFSFIAADVFGLSAAATGGHTHTFADGQYVKMNTENTGVIDLDISDNTTNNVNGSLTLELTNDNNTANITVDATASSDNITTLNLVNDTTAQSTGLKLLAGSGADVVITGSKAVKLDTTATAKSVNASGLNAAFELTLDGTDDIADITGSDFADTYTSGTAATTATINAGGGDDTYTVFSADVITFNGGDDTDTVVMDGAIDAKNLTLSEVEVLSLTSVGVADFKVSQISGKDYVITGDGGDNDEININDASSIDSLTIDLSQLVVDTANVSFRVDGTQITGDFGASSAQTFTGSDAADTYTGNGGDDVITGGEGADVITGGDGDDAIDLTETTSAIDTVHFSAVASNGSDTITGFTQAKDIINVEKLAAGDVAGETAIAANAAATDLTDQFVGVFADGADGAGTEAIADYTDDTDVAAFLNAGLDVSATETFAVVINDLAGGKAYVYNVDVDGDVNDNNITADEVTLVGTITTDDALTIANTAFTA